MKLTVLLLFALGACGMIGCAGSPTHAEPGARTDARPDQKVTTFLMFQGEGEDAVDFYVSLFDDAELLSKERQGGVLRMDFTIDGQRYIATDSPPIHDFTFTPSMSLFVACESDDEIERLHGQLSEGGSELMPLADYGFSQRFAWVVDRFGVSWQLNLN